jgi:DNA ligase D-like protein (predicted 3'-phosphoesterase)
MARSTALNLWSLRELVCGGRFAKTMSIARFVIQEHYARTHHFDFRLEKDGVLKSWAVPKGIPERPGLKRLAVQVEDHDLEFGQFAGAIPQGEYGAGLVKVWDHGTYELEEWTNDRIAFLLHGSRVTGSYHLIRFKHAGPRDWLLIKRKDRA